MKRANLIVLGWAETGRKEEADFTSDGVRIIHTGREEQSSRSIVKIDSMIEV